jgi:hypothetical protein
MTMNTRWTSAVIIAAVAVGGLTACGTSGSSPQAGGTTTASGSPDATMSSGTPQSGDTSSMPNSSAASSPAAAKPVAGQSSAANKPVPPPTNTTGSGSHSFTVPSLSGVVTAHGSYTKLGTSRVKVTICATQTGSAYAVGALALAYNSSGASKNVGAVILPESGTKNACGTKVFLFYTAHLKVHTFIGGNNGTITKTSAVKSIY